MKLLAIDSNSILNRAFYGVPPLTSRDGTHTNAIFGFFNIVLKLIEEHSPDAVAFAFDLRAPTFRHKMYDGYKAQRKGMPPELAMQLPIVRQMIEDMGYKIVDCEGFEADDLLGTLAKACDDRGDTCVIATGDRDSLQLITDRVSVQMANVKGMVNGDLYDTEAFRAKYGIEPIQLIDVKALMGDASDNIPGVPGVGEKTALDLIRRFGTIEEIYANIDGIDVKEGVRGKLKAGRE
ncbi:MAG: DNA polymerase I, partial [Oscillospiraceae bacterium]|nr:DNA polymerase I [Oscillospiraceae bacterium]